MTDYYTMDSSKSLTTADKFGLTLSQIGAVEKGLRKGEPKESILAGFGGGTSRLRL